MGCEKLVRECLAEIDILEAEVETGYTRVEVLEKCKRKLYSFKLRLRALPENTPERVEFKQQVFSAINDATDIVEKAIYDLSREQ